MIKKALYVSIFLNVVLAFSFITLTMTGNLSRVLPAKATKPKLGETTLSSGLADNTKPSIGKTLTTGLTDSQLKMLRLQELKQEHLNTIPLPTDYYWTVTPLQETADFLLAQLDGFNKIRQQLIAEFGQGARSAQEFSEVFRPLAIQHDYLPSEQQIALREFQVKKQAQFMTNPAIGELGGATQMGMMASPMLKDSGLENILTADMLFEYNLRTSPLSSRLRNAGLELTEQQFRDVFTVFEKNTPKTFSPNPDQRDVLASELKSLIGQAPAIKLLASLDPNFQPIKTAGAKNQLTEQQIYSAYQIFSQTDRKVFDAYALREEDPIESNQRIQLAMRERREDLNNLLGEQVARDMLQMRQDFQQRSDRNPAVN